MPILDALKLRVEGRRLVREELRVLAAGEEAQRQLMEVLAVLGDGVQAWAMKSKPSTPTRAPDASLEKCQINQSTSETLIY